MTYDNLIIPETKMTEEITTIQSMATATSTPKASEIEFAIASKIIDHIQGSTNSSTRQQSTATLSMRSKSNAESTHLKKALSEIDSAEGIKPTPELQ